MAQSTTSTAGLDIGKLHLDLAHTDTAPSTAARTDIRRPGTKQADTKQAGTWRFDNTPDGHAALIRHLAAHGIRRIGLEASGGYERAVCAALRAAGIEVILFQPVQVRAFAVYRLRRAKTDPLDAHLIAACTAAYAGPVRAPADPRLVALAEPLRLLEQVEADAARLRTRREAYQDEGLRAQLEEEITRLRAWRRRLLKEILGRLRAEPDLRARLDLVLSVPGLGERTAVTLLVRMPELGSLSREQAASLAGLAPFDRSSGGHEGRRQIAGGRAGVRRALYAAALPAAWRWNAALIGLRERLTAAGKPAKAVLVACARKLLVYANAVVARGRPWDREASAAAVAAE
jgi:transposase